MSEAVVSDVRPSGGARLVTITGVASVVSVAEWMSYWDIVRVVDRYYTGGVSGHIYPAIVDGIMTAASAEVTYRKRKGEHVSGWAWAGVYFGIVTTLGFNILSGVLRGWGAALIATLVSVALLISIELLLVAVFSHERTPGIVAPVIEVSAADTEEPGMTPDTEDADTEAPDMTADTEEADTEAPDEDTGPEDEDTEAPDTDTRARRTHSPRNPAKRLEAARLFLVRTDITGPQLAEELNMEERTARRWLAAMKGGNFRELEAALREDVVLTDPEEVLA